MCLRVAGKILSMQYWLIKSEPFKYSWDQLVADKETVWDGVRNYAARLNLRAMKKGDKAFFYHSNEGLEIVGIATVSKEAYQDPTTDDERWSAVNFKAFKKLKKAVSLDAVKKEPALQQMDLIRLQRLSVQSVKPGEWELILEMSGTKI